MLKHCEVQYVQWIPSVSALKMETCILFVFLSMKLRRAKATDNPADVSQPVTSAQSHTDEHDFGLFACMFVRICVRLRLCLYVLVSAQWATLYRDWVTGVSFLNSQHHQITQCALRGANSSHKMLKHYLGGRKQLDSLESDTFRQAATRVGKGVGGRRGKGGKKL